MATTIQEPTVQKSTETARETPSRSVPSRRRHTRRGRERLALGLGWFSLGIGIAEMAAPGTVARLIGIRHDRRTRRMLAALGIREVASGIGVLLRPERPGWLWARLGGDVIDIALLGSRFASRRVARDRLAAATAAVAGMTFLDALAGRRLSQNGTGTPKRPRGAHPIHVSESITLATDPSEVYRFWRDLENLPRFMKHLDTVRTLDQRRSHWKAKAPAGRRVEWDAEIVEDRPDELIAWRSLPGADVPNAGTVRFIPAPGGRGTELHVVLRYDPPAGAAGAAIAKLFGREPGQQIRGDLRRLKQVIETGEVLHSDASIHAGPHPARPAAAAL